MMEKLAVLGGTPVRSASFPADIGSVGEEEVAEVAGVVQSGKMSMFSNPAVQQFEEAFAKYIGSRYAVMTSSGTAALHLALSAVGVGYGDEVIVPAVTYIATANAVMMQNAVPIFADIDFESCTICIDSVKKCVSPATRALIAVDLFGKPADKKRLMRICETQHLTLIEDCAHALGATYQRKKAGSFGIGCFSFSEGKSITTGGEGGMVTTDDYEIYHIVRVLRHEGEVWTLPNKSAADTRIESFLDFVRSRKTTRVGYNYRPTALQAALGKIQMKKIESLNQRRRDIAEMYLHYLKDVPGIRLPAVNKNEFHTFNRFAVTVDSGAICISRDTFLAALVFEGIPAGVYRPLILPAYPVFTKREVQLRDKPHPLAEVYSNEDFLLRKFPNALRFAAQNVQLPTYEGINREDIRDVVAAIKKINFWAMNQKNLENGIRDRLERIRITKYSGEFIYPDGIRLDDN